MLGLCWPLLTGLYLNLNLAKFANYAATMLAGFSDQPHYGIYGRPGKQCQHLKSVTSWSWCAADPASFPNKVPILGVRRWITIVCNLALEILALLALNLDVGHESHMWTLKGRNVKHQTAEVTYDLMRLRLGDSQPPKTETPRCVTRHCCLDGLQPEFGQGLGAFLMQLMG